MKIRATWIPIKQHRFEVSAAVLACLVLGIWGLVLELRLAASGVPAECLEIWATEGMEAAGECADGSLGAWGSALASEGSRIIATMGYLPFAVGLIGGVPIVARELESRTAQTAWSLTPSRLRWLARQTTPVAALLGMTLAVAALVGGAVQADRELIGESPYANLGHHGPLVMTRAFGAFGLGLLVGALVGRTLSAFVLAAVISVALAVAIDIARDSWLHGLDPSSPSMSSQYASVRDRLIVTEIAWRAPSGNMLTAAQAREMASSAGVPPADADDIQDVLALAWYEENGYSEIALGVTEGTALGWAPYDALAFGIVGLGSTAATLAVVSRRRPAGVEDR